MYQVIKRDGHIADFSLSRISHAITKAFDAQNTPYTPDIINLLALQVTADFSGCPNEGSCSAMRCHISQPPPS